MSRPSAAILLPLLGFLLAALAGWPPARGQGHEGHHGRHVHQSERPRGVKQESEPLARPKLPDAALLDQEGRPVRFYSDLVRGRVVAVNFVFTTCTTICPPMGVNFARLRQMLGERAGRDLHLLSISVDPATDTPARLKAWAGRFGAGPGWTLVTGPPGEVEKVLKAFGVYTPDINNHTPLVFLGNDASGRWNRVYGLAPPERLATLLDQAAGKADREGRR